MRFPSKPFARTLAAATCAACVFGIAAAQSPQPRGGTQPPQLPMAVAAMQSRVHQRAADIDANHDGYVAADELQAFRAARRVDRVQRRITRLDANQDGRVSTVELEAAHLARLAGADANQDGQLTRDEVRAMRMQRRAQRLERHARSLRDPHA